MSLRTQVVVFGIAVVASLSLASAAGAATCKQWNVEGHWEVSQSGEGIVDVKFDLTQSEWRIGGTAYFCERCGQVGPAERFAATYEGTVEGSITGGQLKLTIDWGYERLGEYTALIGPGGDLHDGRTRDLKHPDSTGTWSGNRKAACKSNRPAAGDVVLSNPEPAPPARVKTLGRKTVGATATSDTPLYAGPSVDSGTVGTLSTGVEGVVVDQQGTWYRLEVSGVGITGWAQGATMTFRYIKK